jgi:hypothetical protein
MVACVACACTFSLHARPAQAAVTRAGKLQATVFDDFRDGSSVTRYHLRSGGREIAVQPTELAAEAGERVAVTGEMQGGRLVGSVEATGDGAQVEAVTPGPRKAAVILVTFGGGAPWSSEAARSEVFTGTSSVNAFYKEESYGGISLTGKLRSDGDVFGWYSLNTPTAGCPYTTWRAKAEEAAEDAGADLSGYQHLIFEFPYQSSCPWLGVAGLNSNWAMINGSFGGKASTTAHELGHDLGLLHAGSETCMSGGVRVQISHECTVSEYGDPFDVMGNQGYRHNSGWNLAKLGILGPENVKTVEASGIYTLHSALSPTSQPTVLRIPRTESAGGFVSSWYYLEIRQTGGVFENVSDASTTGVSIREIEEGSTSLLLDANPGTAGFGDAPLSAGETFNAGVVKIKTLSAGGGTATVSVQLDEESPSKPEDLQAIVGADGVQLSWVGADNVGVTRYFVFRDGEQVGNVTTSSYLDFRAPAGDHEYTVIAEDEAHLQSDPSEPLTVAVPVMSGPDCSEAKCKLAFRYSGGPTTWTVPPGVTDAFLTVEGASGGGGRGGPERVSGSGARVWATSEPLMPGQVAEISIGGVGMRYSSGGAGGYNGGGDGGLGGGGGGYTAVSLESKLQVLAAGGGGGGLDGLNGDLTPSAGGGGAGGAEGKDGVGGVETFAQGATLRGGKGGGKGGGGGLGGEGGQITGSSECAGGARVGASGAAGASFAGGGGAADAGGGGGGGYVGGGQGGGPAGDECGATAASAGGAGGSSFVIPGHLNGYDTVGEEGDGRLTIEYDDPIVLAVHSYTTEFDEALVVPAASGVLAGSSAPAGDTLSLSVLNGPAHGSLSLDEDGSFEYVPDSGHAGEDSFQYRADGSAGNYATASVTLTVKQPPAEPEPPEEKEETPGGGGGGGAGGTGSGGNPSPPGPVGEPPPPPPASPQIVFEAGGAGVLNGVTSVGLTCHAEAGARCRGVLSLVLGSVLGRARYAIPSGETATVRVRLRLGALRRLRRARRHTLHVQAILMDSGGQVERRPVVLHLHTRHSGGSPVRKRRSSHRR